MQPRWQTEVALLRAFLARFFENEVTPGSHDLKASLFWLIALLAMPGAIVPALIGLASLQPVSPGAPDPSTWGWAMVAKYQGIDVLRVISRADKTLYIGFAMVASAILSAITWSSVLPDRRDSLVLGVLPVRPASIIGAKLVAVCTYVAIVSVAMHTLASLSFGSFLAAENTAGFAVRGIAAHFVASCAASVFVCLVVVAVQGLALAIVGPRRFTRASPILQAVLVGTVVLGLVTLPMVSSSVVDSLAGHGTHARPWILNTPPLWFLGVYESVLGAPGPVLQQLAATAVAAMAIVLLVILVTYPIACRRLLLLDAVERAGFGRVGRTAVLARLVVRISGRSPETRAVAQHFLSTIGRVGQHRFVMAMALGAAAVWGLPSWMLLASSLPAAPRADLLSLPIAAMLFILAGMRICAVLPSELPAAWLFETYRPSREGIHQALERTMLALGVAPIALVSAIGYGVFWGPTVGFLHAGCTAAVGALLVQSMLWRFEPVPCAQPWAPPAGHLRKWWPLYLLAFAAVTRGLPAIETLVLTHPSWASLFIPYLLALAWWIRRHSLEPPTMRDGESAMLIATALRAGRGVGELSETPGPPSGRRAARPALAVFEAIGRQRDDDERWFDGFFTGARALGRDTRLAFRRLVSTPVFTLFAILSIGLGIGATTASYSVFRSLLWSQPAVKDLDRLAELDGTIALPRGGTRAWSWPDFVDLQSSQTSFSGFAVATPLTQVPLIGGDVAMPASGEAVNGDFFTTMGITPIAGRLIQPHDDRRDAPPVIVLGGGVWRRNFHGDTSIVGKTVTVNDRPFEVIGIAPGTFRSFDFSVLDRPSAFWVPLRTAPVTVAEDAITDERGRRRLVIRARLNGTREMEAAHAEVRAIGRRLEAAYPSSAEPSIASASWGRRWGATASEIRPKGWASQTAGLFIGAIAIVLLIACTNLANLALARGISRQYEIAVRKALGGARGRLVREQLLETVIVGAAGGLVALLSLRVLVVLCTGDVPLGPLNLLVFEPEISVSVLVACGALSLLALGIVGVWPALQLTRSPVREGLANGSGATSLRWPMHRRFVAWQVAGTVTLLLVSFVCVRALLQLRGADTGVDLDRLAVVRLSLDSRQFDGARSEEVLSAITRAVRLQSGVQALALSTGLPFGMNAGGAFALTPAERRLGDIASSERATAIAATPAIFQTLGVRILAGRGFDERDTGAQPHVAVINESSARRVFGSTNVVGRELTLWRIQRTGAPALDERLTVVGVASDTDSGRPGARDEGVVYVPLAQRPSRNVAMIVRTEGDAAATVAVLQSTVRRLAPEAVMTDVGESDAASVIGFVGSLASGLAGVALVLAMTGLYGVMTLVVSRRVREFGVRAALGAGSDRIMRLVFLDGLRPVVTGIGIGLTLAAFCRPIMQASVGLPIAPIDPVAFARVPVPLVAAALIACYVPARRAAGVEAGRALREL